MLTMPNLIHSLLLLSIQLSIFSNSIFFQEIPDLITRSKEVLIPNVVFIPSSELCLIQSSDHHHRHLLRGRND